MQNSVYVVMEWYDYEGAELISVHKSSEGAIKAARTFVINKEVISESSRIDESEIFNIRLHGSEVIVITEELQE